MSTCPGRRCFTLVRLPGGRTRVVQGRLGGPAQSLPSGRPLASVCTALCKPGLTGPVVSGWFTHLRLFSSAAETLVSHPEA